MLSKTATIVTGTKLAALAGHGELVALVARQRRARGVGVHARALHVAVVAHALRALLGREPLAVLVQLALQQALPWRQNRLITSE